MSRFEDQETKQPADFSKSQVKRDLKEIQQLAEALLALPRAELERLELSAATWEAIDETARIKDQRAMRRHYKRVAKLLAREDMQAVQALMHEKQELKRREAARLHQVERWRSRLIDEGDSAMTEFLELCSRADRQQLRTLVRAAQRDQEKGRPDSARKLFRLLREELEHAE